MPRKIGRVYSGKNKKHRFGEAAQYHRVDVLINGVRRTGALTDWGLTSFLDLAEKNPEDIPPRTRWQRFWDKVLDR